MGTDELHEPRVFTKTHREDFNQDTPKRPYLIFKLGPGELQHLIINIWSNDQGWCDEHLKTDDIYANSHTWFSLGLVEESTPAQASPSELLEFQRNVRASSTMRCHTNQWNLDMPAEDDSNEVHAWLESLAQAEDSVIGVYTLARYPGWVNTVWKMEVLVHSKVANLNDTAKRFYDRYTCTNALDDLENAIRVARQAVQATQDDHPDRAAFLNNLGVKLSSKCLDTGSMEDLEEAVCITRQAIKTISGDHPKQAACLNTLAGHLSTRYSRTGAMADLQEAVRVIRQAVKVTPESHPDRARWLNNLGDHLGNRYSRTGAILDLEEAIHTIRQAIEATPQNHQSRSGRLNNLGVRLGDRYLRTGKIEDLEEAIYITRKAVEATPEDHPDRAMWLSNLGSYLGDKHLHTGVMADLDEAICVSRKAVNAVSEDHPNRCKLLNNLGGRLGDRYLCTGTMTNLREAIHLARQAVKTTPEDHPDRAKHISNLGSYLINRYSRIGVIADLEEAIRIARQAVKAIPEDHPDRAGLLNNLGSHLSDRYSRTGVVADLEEAICIARQAVKAIPEDHHKRATLLDNLASHLIDKYSRTSVIANLEEAIYISRQAIEATLKDHSDRVVRLNNLGGRLGTRYSRTGAMVDLEEAIRITRQAVKVTPKTHPNLVALLDNLGTLLHNRYLRTGMIADLEEAIYIARKAVEATPENHPKWARWLNNLGSHLSDRYSRTGVMADLEEAIRITRQAVKTTPEDHPKQAAYLNSLAGHLDTRYSRTGAMADLQEAVRIIRRAIEATPESHPNQALLLHNLGKYLSSRYLCTGAITDLQEIRKAYTTVLDSESAIVSARISAGKVLLSFEARTQTSLQAYHIAQTAVGLVPLSAPLSLHSADKQHHLSRAVGLASDAAAIALHVGQGPIPAIELLETGRCVIASSLQDIRTDLSSLEKKHPNLAQSFVDLRSLLDTPTFSGNLDTTSPVGPPSTTADQRHQANSQMTALLKNIRHQPGFETFLMAATEAQMQDAAAQGPIVIINVSRHRCDALIIEKVGLQALQLHQLTHEDILSKAGQLKSLETLSWLWTVVAKPVLDALGFTKTPPNDDSWPHVWWIPTGPLVRFPLHAAGNHLQGHSETVLDRVVSSYASSVKSIINTRQQPQKPTGNQDLQVVLVAMPKTPSQSVLHHATKEVDTVRGICTSIGVPYRQPQPYQKAVLDDLNSCRVFHFAGHGSTHPIDPLQSRLLLEDWEDKPLSVGNLLDKTNFRSKSPFLAYLSACGTGQILDDKSVDESIHLTSAFQLAGFRHVIGTLWEVDDALCVDMARMTYEFMSEKGFKDESVAYGLHHAMRTLRDQWIRKVESSGLKQKRDAVLITDTAQGTPTWVPYVHYGV
ncbi:hypothetical protein CcaCcLH18_07873 [Colletotrichum camelliae]|nr:hypothetical protein CcaCcLH18_07873 [Colletotrichum camelliae]